MPAIITDRFKKEILLNLQGDIADSANSYYVAVGPSTGIAMTPLLLLLTISEHCVMRNIT
jgi:hypothetical protein